MKTSHVEGRANGHGIKIPMQYVSETHNHKPDAPTRVTKPAPKSGKYSTAGFEHTRNHPEAQPPKSAPARTIPKEVTIWNVESRVSVNVMGHTKQAVFRLKRELWESIGRPSRVNISGNPTKGFRIEWGDDYTCQSNSLGRGLVTISGNVSKVALAPDSRTSIVLRACSRNGVVEIDPPHPLWLAGDPAFVQEGDLRTEPKKPEGRRLSANPQNGTVAPRAPSPTVPLAKVRPADMPMPTDTDLMKAALKETMERATRLKTELEIKTGLKFKFIGNGKGGLDVKIEM